MNISKQGIDLIKNFEKFVAKPYLDAVGISTIGWGFTFYPDGKRVTMNDEEMTEKEADKMLDDIFRMYFAKHLPEVNQNQTDALASLIYNIGVRAFTKSTLLKKVKENPNDPTIKDEFLKWCKATVNGKLVILKGLERRRQKEAQLYFT